MKILCETKTLYRHVPHATTRHNSVKATLAVGFHPPNKENSELFIMHFTPKNSNGIRYKVKDNIKRIYTNFIDDGKVTISFKIPEHDIQIKCNPIQLKCFLRTLKLGLVGSKSELNKLGLSTLATTAIPQKSHPIKKFLITKRSDYPLHGIPKTVETLTITGIDRAKVDSQILFLKNLTSLNLSENCISTIPKELGNLNLIELDLSSNLLGEKTTSKANDWNWLDGLALQKSLKSIDLSKNKISAFPYKLVKFRNLLTLKLNENEMRKIPFAIRRLNNLKTLHLSSNRLESLPNSINHLYLDTLDVWKNNFLAFPMNTEIVSKPKGYVPKLWEIAARVIESKRISYSSETVPWLLVDIMAESPLCICGLLSFSSRIYQRSSVITLDHVKNLVFSRDQLIFQDAAVCSDKCASKLYSTLL